MNNLVCEHPTIIMNPHLRDEVLLHANYTLRGEYNSLSPSVIARWYYEFPYGIFGTRKNNITHNDLESCYITNVHTGECIPMFYEVPCNKCILCRDKKAREWSTRAMCEAQSSSGYPLFVTLTYDNIHLPKEGVNKLHAQNFMKRLRVNLNRYLGYDVNLRFFLCAEYGSKTKRPHYHALIYNFPILDSLKRTLSIIEKSWSFAVSKKNLPGGLIFRDDKSNRYRQQFGFVYVQHAQGGHVKYCMKYMRKDCEKPFGLNDVFYLSSRRRGLGFQWLQEHYDEYVNDPQLTDVTFTDKWSMANYTAAMPTYFKTYLYPTISRILPKNIRDDFGLLVHWLGVRDMLLSTDFRSLDEKIILEKYAPLFNAIPKVLCETPLKVLRDELKEDNFSYLPYKLPYRNSRYELPKKGLVCLNRCYNGRPSESETIDEIIFDHITEEISVLVSRLLQYDYDKSIYYDSQSRKEKRIAQLQLVIDSQPEVDIVSMTRDVYQRRQRQLAAETF